MPPSVTALSARHVAREVSLPILILTSMVFRGRARLSTPSTVPSRRERYTPLPDKTDAVSLRAFPVQTRSFAGPETSKAAQPKW